MLADSVPIGDTIGPVLPLAADPGEAIDVPASRPGSSLLDLCRDGDRVSLSCRPALEGPAFGLSGLALLAEDRGVMFDTRFVVGVDPPFCRRGESIGAWEGADRLETEGDGVVLLVAVSSRGAGEERNELVVAGNLGIRGRGGGKLRLLRSRVDIAQD